MPTTVTYDALLGLTERALIAHGYSALAAAPIARTITQCERDGTRSHGLLRLPGYIEAVRSGWADGTVLPRVTARSPSMLVTKRTPRSTRRRASRQLWPNLLRPYLSRVSSLSWLISKASRAKASSR